MARPNHRSSLFTTNEVAKMVQVDPKTLVGWVEQGKLACFRTPGGHRRFQQAEVVRFMDAYGFPIPAKMKPLAAAS